MRFCANCGNEISDDARFCQVCGTVVTEVNNIPNNQNQYENPQYANPVNNPYENSSYNQYTNPAYGTYQNPAPYPQFVTPNGLETAAFVLMVLATIGMGVFIIPLAWCIPMTVYYYKRIHRAEPVGIGFKVCALLFVGVIAGILMLCDEKC